MTDIKQRLLEQAGNIVNGARRAAYGTPEDNFERIARFWQAYFDNTGRDVTISAADVSPLMRLMKEARLCESPDHEDSFVDIIGYALTGAEINLPAPEEPEPAKLWFDGTLHLSAPTLSEEPSLSDVLSEGAVVDMPNYNDRIAMTWAVVSRLGGAATLMPHRIALDGEPGVDYSYLRGRMMYTMSVRDWARFVPERSLIHKSISKDLLDTIRAS